MKKYLTAFVVVCIIAYPATIQADTKIVAAGATPTVTATTLNLVPVSKMTSKVVWITAYASVPGETDDTPFITASGDLTGDGIIAANFLPFGTKVQIPALFGNKVFTVEDRMNQIFNQRVDIWMPTVTAAIDFGIRHTKIIVLNQDLAVE